MKAIFSQVPINHLKGRFAFFLPAPRSFWVQARSLFSWLPVKRHGHFKFIRCLKCSEGPFNLFHIPAHIQRVIHDQAHFPFQVDDEDGTYRCRCFAFAGLQHAIEFGNTHVQVGDDGKSNRTPVFPARHLPRLYVRGCYRCLKPISLVFLFQKGFSAAKPLNLVVQTGEVGWVKNKITQLPFCYTRKSQFPRGCQCFKIRAISPIRHHIH